MSHLGDQALRSILLWETGRARKFWASVHVCTLQSFSKFVSNLNIGPSSFSVLMTKLVEHSFYEKRILGDRQTADTQQTGISHNFWASVLACMLQPFPKFVSNLRICPSSFLILVTTLSDHSFYGKLAVHASFGLVCMHARSNPFQNLWATLKLVHLHFLFWWPHSQSTPSMGNWPCAQVLG